MNPLIARLMPFIALVIFLIFVVIGIFVFSYVLIFALIVGFILFVVGFIRAKFGGVTQKSHDQQVDIFITEIKKENAKNAMNNEKGPGRIIEHDE